MKYVDEFRSRTLIDKVAKEIRNSIDENRTYNIMEVCGTHTMSIFRYGLKDILPENIRLISGPGCPVCVTPNSFLDKAIYLSKLKDVIIATFGDMLKVPGSFSSLEKERANGAAIKTVYSTTDAVALAKRNAKKNVVFLGIGFETTAPTIAQSILTAKREKIRNYSVLCGNKTMPEVLEVLTKDSGSAIDGFLLPGHVSTIIGVKPYEFLAKRYGKRCVVAGFEPLDIMQAVLMLISQKAPAVEIQYTRIVGRLGNKLAQNSIKKVFRKCSSDWRGIGAVKDSGLAIKDEFASFDAETIFNPKPRPSRDDKGCMCGQILRGAKTPLECALFSRACTPENPIGACMVSGEGTCAAYYKYKK